MDTPLPRQTLPEPTPDMLSDTAERKAQWLRAFAGAVASDGADAQRLEAIARDMGAFGDLIAALQSVKTHFRVYTHDDQAVLDAVRAALAKAGA